MLDEKIVLEKFLGGVNCCASVFGAFAEELGLSLETARKISTGFGSGIGCGNVCGAVSGGLMALGLKYGECADTKTEATEKYNAKRKAFFEAFTAQNGTLFCKEIMGLDPNVPENRPILAERGTRANVCAKVIVNTCKLIEEMLKED